MYRDSKNEAARDELPVAGIAGWLVNRLRGARRGPPLLAVLERIALAPRQSLVLVEADGRRFLVATSPEGAPAFYALEQPSREALFEPSWPAHPAPAGGLSAVPGSREPESRMPGSSPRRNGGLSITEWDARTSW